MLLSSSRLSGNVREVISSWKSSREFFITLRREVKGWGDPNFVIPVKMGRIF
jgi:hypothetical protein